MFDVEFYTLPDERKPVEEFLNSFPDIMRIKFSSDISRIFYFFYVGNKIVVTNGFIKKTQKTPETELERAQKYKKDYERRHKP